MARREPTPKRRERRRSPKQLFDSGDSDFELYERDGKYVLHVELPGFDTEDIDLRWDDGLLRIAAEHEDERRDRQRTYHRRFRFPKDVDDDQITAEYTNGILEVELPIRTEPAMSGREIDIA